MEKDTVLSSPQFEAIRNDLFKPLGKRTFTNKLWTRFLLLIILLGSFSYGQQLMTGLGVTAMRDYSAWGIYIGHFVFMVALSLVGSLVAAILKLSGHHWSTPATRISEIIAVAAVAFAAVTIVMDMGRPDRLLNVFLHGRISSPILWDVTVIHVYLLLSLILLYLPMIPDLAILRDQYHGIPKWQHRMYDILAVGWKGTQAQWKLLKKAIYTMMVLIMPVAFSIHTVTSWLFAVNNRAGWNSTIFGPYFVSGAFMLGAAAVILAMFILRKAYKYDKYLNDQLFNRMGQLLVLTSLVYLYFNINEYMVPGYKMQKLEGAHLRELFTGKDAPYFWFAQIGGLVLPILFGMFKTFRKPMPLLVISILVILGAWVKRMIIVIPTQFHPGFPIQNVPPEFTHYVPTYHELMITAAIVAGVLLIITHFIKYFPIIPVYDVAKDHLQGDEAKTTPDSH